MGNSSDSKQKGGKQEEEGQKKDLIQQDKDTKTLRDKDTKTPKHKNAKSSKKATKKEKQKKMGARRPGIEPGYPS